MRCLVPLLLVLGVCSASDEDEVDLSQVNRDGWVDPFDMINYDGTFPEDIPKPPPLKENIGKSTKQDVSDSSVKSEIKQDNRQEKIVNKKAHPQSPGTGSKVDSIESKIKLDTHQNVEIKSDRNNVVGVSVKHEECSKTLSKLTKDHEELEKVLSSCGQTEISHIKRYVRSLLQHFPHQVPEGETLMYEAHIKMASSDSQILHRYAHTDKGNVHDVFDALGHLIGHTAVMSDVYVGDKWARLEDMIGVGLGTVLQVVCIITLILVIIKIQVSLHLSWPSLLWKLFCVLFMISIPWNWWHQYKMVVAKRQAEVMREAPAECRPEQMTSGQTLMSWFKSAFTFSSDACAKYHEALMVDPMWEVAPTKAVAVTLTKFILEPVEHIGRAISKFLRAVLEDLPVHLWPIVLATLIALLVVCVIMAFGYRIKLFGFFGLEPCQQVNPRIENMLQDINRKVDSQHSLSQSTSASALSDKPMTSSSQLMRSSSMNAIEYENKADPSPDNVKPMCIKSGVQIISYPENLSANQKIEISPVSSTTNQNNHQIHCKSSSTNNKSHSNQFIMTSSSSSSDCVKTREPLTVYKPECCDGKGNNTASQVDSTGSGDNTLKTKNDCYTKIDGSVEVIGSSSQIFKNDTASLSHNEDDSGDVDYTASEQNASIISLD